MYTEVIFIPKFTIELTIRSLFKKNFECMRKSVYYMHGGRTIRGDSSHYNKSYFLFLVAHSNLKKPKFPGKLYQPASPAGAVAIFRFSTLSSRTSLATRKNKILVQFVCIFSSGVEISRVPNKKFPPKLHNLATLGDFPPKFEHRLEFGSVLFSRL